MKVIDGRESCVRTLHAESNALDQAGGDAYGCSLYTTAYPCFECAKRIVNAGIRRVAYGEFYESRLTGLVADFFEAADVSLWLEKIEVTDGK
jgi:dCMP deaminase